MDDEDNAATDETETQTQKSVNEMDEMRAGEDNEPGSSGITKETEETQEKDASETEETQPEPTTQMVLKQLSRSRSKLVEETRKIEVVEKPKKKRRVVKRKKSGFKVMGDEVTYKTQTPRLTKMMASRPPVVLQKCYLKQVIKKMRDVKMNKPKKNRHKLPKVYGETGEIALQKCINPSIEKIINNFSPNSVYRCTFETMFRRIRGAMLDHNWSHCFSLFARLVRLKGLTRYNALYVLRVIIVAVLNSNVGGEELEKFLRITLGLSSDESRQEFLTSLFVLPWELKKPRMYAPRTRRKELMELQMAESSDEDKI